MSAKQAKKARRQKKELVVAKKQEITNTYKKKFEVESHYRQFYKWLIIKVPSNRIFSIKKGKTYNGFKEFFQFHWFRRQYSIGILIA